MRTIRTLIAALACLALAACDQPEPPASTWQNRNPGTEQAQATAAPAQQAPQHQDTTMRDMALGGLIGYMLGGSGSRAAPGPAPQVTNIYQEPTHRAPAYVPAPAAVRQAVPGQPTRPAPVPVPAPKVAVAPAPAPKPAPLPQAAPAPRPSYSGPSSYSSVRQSAPAYRYTPSPSRSSGRR